jgi:cytochrome c-type biogenesis protein CcsB
VPSTSDIPHPSVAQASDVLFRIALIVYALGMLAFFAELAFARRGAVAGRRVEVPTVAEVPAAEAALVGAGSSLPDAPAAVDRGVATGGVTTPAASTGQSLSARFAGWGGLALGLVMVGWLTHLAEVVTRGIGVGRAPWGNMYEFSSAICVVVVAGFLVQTFQGRVERLGSFVMLPVVLYLGLAGTVLYAKASPLQPVLSNSYWLVVHVFAAITATGVLMLSGVVSSVHLARRRYERLVTAGRAPGFAGVTRRLPNAKALDRAEYRLIVFGFPIWTFAIMAGAIWAEAAWGHYWQWDPKETWALISWIVYAGYLHARSTPGLRKWAAHVATLAFATMIFNYYVVNLFIVGEHSYAGVKTAGLLLMAR